MMSGMPTIHDWLFTLGRFFQTGGWVLYPILIVSVLMLLLLIERMIFRFFDYPQRKAHTVRDMEAQPEVVQKLSILCDLDLALKSQFPVIKTLIALCPLIGLLGTVTGMIQVFDSLAIYGTGNPRLMAAGVASATFPTMTGMAVAVVGILFYNRLSVWSENERKALRLMLSGSDEPLTSGQKGSP